MLIATFIDIPMFNIKYLAMHKLQMHAGAISKLMMTNHIVDSEILARVYFRETSRMRSFAKLNPREMAKSLCRSPI